MGDTQRYQNRIELLQGTLSGFVPAGMSEWKLTESKQRAKFYQLTPMGRKQLASEHQRWLEVVRTITAVMERDVVEA